MKSKKIKPTFPNLENAASIKKHISETKEKIILNKKEESLFNVKSANEWIDQAKVTPVPQMLFGELWFENELCILFADTNLGKSILAVQIADSISYGKHIPGFILEADAQLVIYFDFELTSKQFEVRYAIKNEGAKTYESHYIFDKKLKRVEIDPDADVPENSSFEEYLNQSLEKTIIDTGAKVLIIDNITYLRNETEKAKDALPLMKHLKALKSKYNLSILALAHTPKRDLSKAITRNDLQGSKMLINFVDSCFAIGESHTDKYLRYIKQIKARNTEIIYDTENVATCQIQKPHNFLEFEFVSFDAERKHLKTYSENDRDELIQQAKDLQKERYSQRQISTKLGISLGAVNKYLNM